MKPQTKLWTWDKLNEDAEDTGSLPISEGALRIGSFGSLQHSIFGPPPSQTNPCMTYDIASYSSIQCSALWYISCVCCHITILSYHRHVIAAGVSVLRRIRDIFQIKQFFIEPTRKGHELNIWAIHVRQICLEVVSCEIRSQQFPRGLLGTLCEPHPQPGEGAEDPARTGQFSPHD